MAVQPAKSSQGHSCSIVLSRCSIFSNMIYRTGQCTKVFSLHYVIVSYCSNKTSGFMFLVQLLFLGSILLYCPNLGLNQISRKRPNPEISLVIDTVWPSAFCLGFMSVMI